MTQKHNHLTVRAGIGWCPHAEDMTQISDWVRALIGRIKMMLFAGPYTSYVNEYSNSGLINVEIIETSHIDVHKWDETDLGLLQPTFWKLPAMVVRRWSLKSRASHNVGHQRLVPKFNAWHQSNIGRSFTATQFFTKPRCDAGILGVKGPL